MKFGKSTESEFCQEIEDINFHFSCPKLREFRLSLFQWCNRLELLQISAQISLEYADWEESTITRWLHINEDIYSSY